MMNLLQIIVEKGKGKSSSYKEESHPNVRPSKISPDKQAPLVRTGLQSAKFRLLFLKKYTFLEKVCHIFTSFEKVKMNTSLVAVNQNKALF